MKKNPQKKLFGFDYPPTFFFCAQVVREIQASQLAYFFGTTSLLCGV